MMMMLSMIMRWWAKCHPWKIHTTIDVQDQQKGVDASQSIASSEVVSATTNGSVWGIAV
jgi:hypothetical protein